MKIKLDKTEIELLIKLVKKGNGVQTFQAVDDWNINYAYDLYYIIGSVLPSLEKLGFVRPLLMKLENKSYAEDLFLKRYFSLLDHNFPEKAFKLANDFGIGSLNILLENGLPLNKESFSSLMGEANIDEAYCKDLCFALRLEMEITPQATEFVAQNVDSLLKDKEKEKDMLLGPPRPVSFDADNSILYLRGNSCRVTKHSKQYECLKAIFTDINKEWQLSEVAEMCDINTAFQYNFNWKDFYNYFDALRKNIAINTGIKDFFILTTQSVKIDPKYIKIEKSNYMGDF